ncbi:MAG: hypothetical protein ACXVCY_03130 [Pseudobdellovibrionaceae bacterium]
MEDLKNVLVCAGIGTVASLGVAVGIFMTTMGMCALCTAGMLISGG